MRRLNCFHYTVRLFEVNSCQQKHLSGVASHSLATTPKSTFLSSLWCDGVGRTACWPATVPPGVGVTLCLCAKSEMSKFSISDLCPEVVERAVKVGKGKLLRANFEATPLGKCQPQGSQSSLK